MRVVAKPASSARVARQQWLATTLVLTAGYIDGYGLFAYGTFLSFMSGNTTLTGYNLGRLKPDMALPSAVAIAGFVGGAAVGAVLVGQSRRRHRLMLGLTAGLEVLVLLAVVDHSAPALAAIGVLSAAMGILNFAVTHIGAQHVSLTFVTGTLTQVGQHLASVVRRAPLADATDLRDTHARRAMSLAVVWVAFLAGAAAGGFIAPRLATWALAPAIGAHVALALLARDLDDDAGSNRP